MSRQISNSMYEALRHKYESDILTAKASLLVYFNNAVGIGEHPQHLEEMDKLLDSMATANDKMEMLTKMFCQYDPNHTEEIRRASP